jgi:glycerol-3-phosphate dehydrogenase (NAD(P)+)
MLLGKGVAPEEAVKQVGMVVEGINALPAAMRLKEKYAVEMPIVDAVNAIVNLGATPMDTVKMLMGRGKKPELPPTALNNCYDK